MLFFYLLNVFWVGITIPVTAVAIAILIDIKRPHSSQLHGLESLRLTSGSGIHPHPQGNKFVLEVGVMSISDIYSVGNIQFVEIIPSK